MPTALELSAEERREYVRAARVRLAAAEEPGRALARRRSLLAKARKAAAMLKQSYGATRVILFGSLAHRAWLHPGSDIDLAVEGITAAQYWDAWAAVEGLLTAESVDLVDLADAGLSLRQEIEAYGVEL